MDREREKHGDLPFSRTTFTLYPRRIKVFNFFHLLNDHVRSTCTLGGEKGGSIDS